MRLLSPSPWVWLLLTFLLLPVAVLISYVFVEELRLERLWRLGILQRDLTTSLTLALSASTLALLLAFPAAWMQARYRFPLGPHLSWLLLLPLAMPPFVLAYVYADLSSFAGPVQSSLRALFPDQAQQFRALNLSNMRGAALVFALSLYPYAYLLLRRTIAQQGDAWLEAAHTLGSSRAEALRRIVLPMLRPALLIGAALVALESLADLGVSELLGVRTLAVRVKVLWLNKGELGSAAAVALILLVLSVLIFSFARWLEPQGQGDSRVRPIKTYALRGWRGLLATGYQVTLISLGFVLPLAWLVRRFFSAGIEGWSDPQLWETALNSLRLGLYTAMAAVIFSLLLLVIMRFARNAQAPHVLPLASYGYGTPGLVLALGCLAPAFALDHLFARWQVALGWEPQALLTASLFALIFALGVRYLAVAIGPLDAAYERIPRASDAAARTLGMHQSGVFWRNHLPQLSPALATAFLFIFIETLKELPATLLARPPGFESLATRFFALALDERVHEAAPYALVLVALSLPFVFFFARAGRLG